MNDSVESRTEGDHYEAALEASCDALMTLQSLCAAMTQPVAELGGSDNELARAIHSLRRAIAELRMARPGRSGSVVDAFVLAPDAPGSPATGPTVGQSKPRRTA